MNKLLSGGFYRLCKNRMFWILFVAVFVGSFILVWRDCTRAAELNASGIIHWTFDDVYYEGIPWIGVFYAAFTSLFIGTEYSEGTIRNQMIVGHTRAHVYLSNYTVCLGAGEGFTVAALLSGLIGVPILGTWRIGFVGTLCYFVLIIFLTAALVGIFTFLCMLLGDTPLVTTVTALLCALAMIFLSSYLYNNLGEPEFISDMLYTTNGVMSTEPMPNPAYVGGMKRAVYSFILDFLPSGQTMLMANAEVENPVRMLLSSIGIICMTTIGGLCLFKRKDLR